MNNSWNRFIYRIGSPIYDKFFNSGVFLNARKKIFQSIVFNNQQKILFVGVGTGADLELINHNDLKITAIDYSPDMLRKAKGKFEHSTITFLEMDAQNLEFENESFDYVVASLILSVVPDATKCFQEMTRVLKQEGRIIVFDKFVPKNQKLSLPKILLRPIISLLGTDIGRSFDEISPENIVVEEDTPIMFNGMYRKIIIRKIY
ncbi:phosphatidylethanolamine N-methyltransferase [Lysinibacillus sphaericus]|uniref:class I SAM-dependent methyltransferase n=1 Tax=Lysinibacillus sphaericus TaxID=1421 RepID=UPI0018CFCA9F|nr:class I SAM-dependent methyltransferase [Lysinibacillus sphaericus]MBG9453239.1 phosphatidylethanolamine N-methyltransferase [Lysinibacillus sphaericus]MBG9476093.1 phosphatidylethanolamine N-methyltransferase [Lysinibacillus sphaericus]MBG9591942.1 phosphatidylethanolamine N-methyltransferase [Lysinibacillus sphaericus]